MFCNVSPEQVMEVFGKLPAALRAPAFHPDYVRADARRDEALHPEFFIYTENERVYYHGFHLARVPGTEFWDVQSPYGYGGPVASTEERQFLSRAWQAYCGWCAERHVLAEMMRFHPVARNWRFYAGDVLADRETVWIDLTSDDLETSYAARRRGDLRKARRNDLSVDWGKGPEFIDHFRALYEDMLRAKSASDFYRFPPSYYEALLECEGSFGGMCRRGETVLAAAIFLLQDTILEYHLSAASGEGQRLGAMALLLHEAGSFGQRSGCRVLHLGGGTDRRPENSLLFFKAGFSERRAAFKTGRCVHRPEVYESMKTEWEGRRREAARRVLFYRD